MKGTEGTKGMEGKRETKGSEGVAASMNQRGLSTKGTKNTKGPEGWEKSPAGVMDKGTGGGAGHLTRGCEGQRVWRGRRSFPNVLRT